MGYNVEIVLDGQSVDEDPPDGHSGEGGDEGVTTAEKKLCRAFKGGVGGRGAEFGGVDSNTGDTRGEREQEGRWDSVAGSSETPAGTVRLGMDDDGLWTISAANMSV
jgi:hypothetical protein